MRVGLDKKSSTPAGCHICRNGLLRRRGCGYHLLRLLQICHPAGVDAPKWSFAIALLARPVLIEPSNDVQDL